MPAKKKTPVAATADATAAAASTTAMATAAPEKPKPKAKASKRARADDAADDGAASKEEKPMPAVNENMELIDALEQLMYYEFKHGDQFAALAHLKCANVLRKRFMHKLAGGAKDIPWNFGESAGCDRSEYIGRGHRQLIDEFILEDKKALNRLEELKAEHGTTATNGAAAVIDDALRAEVMAKEVVGTPVTQAVKDKVGQEATVLTASTVDALKAMLRSNRQPVTGAKAELVRRVAECIVMGALPACPSCYGGKLKFDIETGIYSCNGFMDDDEYHFCYYRAADAERGAWQV